MDVLTEKVARRGDSGPDQTRFSNRLELRSFKASGVVVGRKRPDNNARPYAPVGRIGRKPKYHIYYGDGTKQT